MVHHLEIGRHWLLPSRKNHYHPHILRPLGLGFIFLLLFLQPVIYNGVNSRHFQVLGYATDISAASLYDMTNQQRAQTGLAPLTLNSELVQAAQSKAADMFAKDYWAHDSPDGLTPWSFIIGAAGYSYDYAGENLAKDFDTSAGVINGWMNSPEHRANILSSHYKDVGFAVRNGLLLGSQTTLVVAMYASPLYAPAAAPASSPVSPAPAEPRVSPPAAAPVPAASVPGSSSTSIDSARTELSPDEKQIPPGRTKPGFASIVSPGNLNWAQKVTVFLLSILLLINVLKHTLVWRIKKHAPNNIWMRSHPLIQSGLLALTILITLASSWGVVL